MTAYELLEILKDHYKDDKILIEEVNDLLEQMYKGDWFAYKLDYKLEEYCLGKDICPLCGGDIIEIDRHDEYIGEYQGIPACETFRVFGCEDNNCSYVVE